MADKWLRRWRVTGKTDVYTVALHQDGHWGCSCPQWRFRRKQLADEECDHIKDHKQRLLNPPKPWPGALAALQDLPPGNGEPTDDLSADARKLVAYAEREYVERGYMYSACLHYNGMKTELGKEPWDAIEEVTESGMLEGRACTAYALQLPAARRWQLIHERNLYDAWMRDGACFYPSDRYGEICNVWQELMDFQFCERCRTWYVGEHGDCDEFDFMKTGEKNG